MQNKTKRQYNGGRIGHHKPKAEYKGRYYLHGIGCRKVGKDCFTCPLPDCTWNG